MNKPGHLSFIDQLDQPEVRQRIAMHIGAMDFSILGHFLRGYERATADFGNRELLFNGFREWLHMRLNGSGNISWDGLIREAFGDGENAILKFFELWDAFRNELKIKGLDAILEEHCKYELSRYGMLSSARKRKSGQNTSCK